MATADGGRRTVNRIVLEMGGQAALGGGGGCERRKEGLGFGPSEEAFGLPHCRPSLVSGHRRLQVQVKHRLCAGGSVAVAAPTLAALGVCAASCNMACRALTDGHKVLRQVVGGTSVGARNGGRSVSSRTRSVPDQSLRPFRASDLKLCPCSPDAGPVSSICCPCSCCLARHLLAPRAESSRIQEH